MGDRNAREPDIMLDGCVMEQIEQRVAGVQAELAAVVGGASLCAVSKAAGSVPAAKHLEGRLAALSQLRRAMRDTDDVHAMIRDLHGEWRRGLEQAVAKDFGPDWRAYRAGGVDELNELTAALPNT